MHAVRQNHGSYAVSIEAITCRECYGLERYRRAIGVPIGGQSFASVSAPEEKFKA
jgi:hypothetical protein